MCPVDNKSVMFQALFFHQVGDDQGWGQVKYLYLVLDAKYRVLGTYLVLDTLKFKSTWYLLVLGGKILDTCPSTPKYFCQLTNIQA